jgi:type VI secretion system secreted protein VgrG
MIAWQRYGSGHVHGVLFNGNALADIERNRLHQETKRTQGSVTHTMSYAQSGQLAQHMWADTRTAAKPWRTWEHDWTGNVKTLDDSMRGKRGYQYDALSRLTNAGNEQFIYDATGNMLDVSSLDPIGYGNPAGDRLHTLRTGRQRYEQYAYDAHGRRTERAENGDVTMRYGYDAVHQLREVTQANGVNARYEYDALGRRVAKHVTAKGRTTTTLFVWDGDWMIQEITNGKAITYVKHPDHAGPLAKIENGKVYHYVNDHLGTPQELHDASGKIVWAAEYSAYGLVRKYLVDEISNPIRFAGQYYDAETGLRYNRFRYYDPLAGRYLTQDPIGLKGGINQYAYVKGNPVLRVDPLGLQEADAYDPVFNGNRSLSDNMSDIVESVSEKAKKVVEEKSKIFTGQDSSVKECIKSEPVSCDYIPDEEEKIACRRMSPPIPKEGEMHSPGWVPPGFKCDEWSDVPWPNN